MVISADRASLLLECPTAGQSKTVMARRRTLLMFIALAWSPVHVTVSAAEQDKVLAAPVEPAEILGLIADLGDPSYETRTFATRRLVAAGMPAYGPLKEAADGENLEIALRAKRILGILDSLLFSGCDLTIEFGKPAIRWNEPVDLVVRVVNRSQFACRVPFESLGAKRDQASSDARQVADMLDIGEWLQVFGPDGKPVSLKVDDISADPQVIGVVQDRLNAGPAAELAPGASAALTARLFNLGWARYPLLEAGEHTAVFDYVPQWNDEALADSKIGRVRSNLANLRITEAAPPAISRDGVEAEVSLDRDQQAVVARLTNRSELPIVVNLNFGPSPPFAQSRWVFEAAEALVEVPATPARAQSWEDFRASKLAELAAGASLELARASLAELRREFSARGADFASSAGSFRFQYSNLCDRAWQLREGMELLKDPKVPEVLRKPLPRRLITIHQSSPSLPSIDLR